MVFDDYFLPLKIFEMWEDFLKPIYSNLSLRHVVFSFTKSDGGEVVGEGEEW